MARARRSHARLSRVAGAVAVVAGVVAATLVMLGSAGPYRVVAEGQDAGQLVKGNLVKVGGVTVGRVERITLGDRNEARIHLVVEDEDLEPLHAGTKATIRSTSLSSIAGRSVALEPGPNSAPEIESGGTIPAQDMTAVVELDQLVNALDLETRSALQDTVRGLASSTRRRGPQLARALDALSPALRETRTTARELIRDQHAFERALVTSAGVVGTVADERATLERAVDDAATAVGALASESDALDGLLRRAPSSVRLGQRTIAELRQLFTDLAPVLEDARPAVRDLAPTLRALRPVTRRARPALPVVRGLLRDATPVLRRLPSTERSARPAFASASSALAEADPVVAGLRAYLPDVVAGLLNGFGGTTAGYYDANGHYVRISLQGNAFTFQGLGSAPDAPSGDGQVIGFRRGVVARCPGAATQAHPSGDNNPWRPPEAPCDAKDDAP